MAEVNAKNWMMDLPTTDEEAIEFLHYDKNPLTYPSIDALYKIYREHDKLDILEACKKTLKDYLGEANG